MITCKECGVELEDRMQSCPLCGTSVLSGGSKDSIFKKGKESTTPDVQKKHLLGKIMLQVISIMLLSCIAATVIINVAIERKITWSLYPATACLIVLCYVPLISLWRTRAIYQLFGGWILAAIVLVIIHSVINEEWPLMLALPILCASNIIALLLSFVLRTLKSKGLNIFAIALLAIAMLCLIIEGTISLYLENVIKLRWSAIVSACLLPMTAAIVFMYFRIKNNSDLKKIFHT